MWGYYELQEGESHDDFESCECGGKLKEVPSQITPLKKQGMNSTTKILIVVLIVLIAGIGVAAGMLLMSKESVVNNITNNSVNVSNPNITTPTTTTSSDNNDNSVMISAQKAEQIATAKLWLWSPWYWSFFKPRKRTSYMDSLFRKS